jgi:transposase
VHIRIHRSKTASGKQREYAQLVHSYRRADGMPTHRVLATLGPPDSLVVQNMRQALADARKGIRSAPDPQRSALPTRPVSNLRYLDAAVLLELWKRLGLEALLEKLMPRGQAELAPSALVASLVIQRCLEPGSKRFASQWVPNTALPQLFGFDPDSFNNTRIHRVLEQLDEVSASVMAQLPKLYQQQTGSFKCLFLDVTDTWFVGQGPSYAQSAKTKEGMMRRKIGIVLLCNEDDLPIRWQVVEGKYCDAVVMTDMLRSVTGLSWADAVPVVMDRAVGQSARLQQLQALNVCFLTALCKPEFSSYAPHVPYDCTRQLQVDDSNRQQTESMAAQCVQQAGLTRVDDDLFVLDLGIVQRGDVDQVATTKVQASDTLLPCIQQDILAGRAEGHSFESLCQIAKLPKDKQRDAFDALLARAPARKKPKRTQVVTEQLDPPVQVRAVAYFNPQRFVDKRLRANLKLQRVQKKVQDIVLKANHNPNRTTVASLRLQVDRILNKESLLDVYSVDIRLNQHSNGYEVCVEPDPTKWAAKCRYDGWSILVAHPTLTDKSASELCELYRAKDAVEKDVQVIKSFTELRPVRHRTDDKVGAHVTICMLALLLERTLHKLLSCNVRGGQRRAKSTESLSAAAALELLEPCRLNCYAPTDGGQPAYLLTATKSEQWRILAGLTMTHLAQDEYLAELLEKAL